MWNQPNDLVTFCTDLHRLCDPEEGLMDNPCSEALLWQHSHIPTLPQGCDGSAQLCSLPVCAGSGSVSLTLVFKNEPRPVWKVLMGSC